MKDRAKAKAKLRRLAVKIDRLLKSNDARIDYDGEMVFLRLDIETDSGDFKSETALLMNNN